MNKEIETTIEVSERESKKEDLDFLVKNLEEIHPNPYRNINQEKEIFQKSLEKSLEVPEEFFHLAVQESLALLQDLHTGVDGLIQKPYPIKLLNIDNNYYIIGTDSKNSETFGKQLIKINEHPLEKIATKLSKLSSKENPEVLASDLEIFLKSSEALRYYGFSHEDTIKITTETGKYDINLTERLSKGANPILWRKEDYESKNYFGNEIYQFRVDGNTLLFQYNKCTNQNFTEEYLSSFQERLLKKAQDVNNIVVDMRLNGGGPEEIMHDLFEKLPTDKNFYVAMGRHTKSSAIHHLAFLKQKRNALLVGETAGQTGKRFGNRNLIILPNTQTRVIISSKEFDLIPEQKTEMIEPDIKIPVTIEDYVNDTDPLNKWIKENLK